MLWIQFAHPSTCRDIVVIVTFIDVAQMLQKQYSNGVQYDNIRVHALQYNMAALAYGKQNYNFVRQEFVTANTV
jgi:hypothetical protein